MSAEPCQPSCLSGLLGAADQSNASGLVEAVARRVVELLSERDEGRMLTAAEVGARLGRSRDWVYSHRSELGAVALGEGTRPRLGFPSERVNAYSSSRRPEQAAKPAPKPNPPPRRRVANGQGDRFLPIRGSAPS